MWFKRRKTHSCQAMTFWAPRENMTWIVPQNETLKLDPSWSIIASDYITLRLIRSDAQKAAPAVKTPRTSGILRRYHKL